MKTAEALPDGSRRREAPFQALATGQPVDLKELMSEVTARRRRGAGQGRRRPDGDGPAGLTGLSRVGTGAGGGSTGGGDLVAELERLTTLHQAGNLTDEEFSAAKQNLIKGQS